MNLLGLQVLHPVARVPFLHFIIGPVLGMLLPRRYRTLDNRRLPGTKDSLYCSNDRLEHHMGHHHYHRQDTSVRVSFRTSRVLATRIRSSTTEIRLVTTRTGKGTIVDIRSCLISDIYQIPVSTSIKTTTSTRSSRLRESMMASSNGNAEATYRRRRPVN